MSDPVSALLFSVGVALLLWGGLQGERRRPALALLAGASAAALVALLSESAAWSGLAAAVGAAVGGFFDGWGGPASRPRGSLGGGWSESGRFGGGGGGASGSW